MIDDAIFRNQLRSSAYGEHEELIVGDVRGLGDRRAPARGIAGSGSVRVARVIEQRPLLSGPRSRTSSVQTPRRLARLVCRCRGGLDARPT